MEIVARWAAGLQLVVDCGFWKDLLEDQVAEFTG